MDTLQWAYKVGRREKRGESSAWTLCSGLQKQGGGRRGERAVRGWRARARPRAGSATRPLRREEEEGSGHAGVLVAKTLETNDIPCIVADDLIPKSNKGLPYRGRQKLPTSPLYEAIRVPQTNQEGARNFENAFSLYHHTPPFLQASVFRIL